MLKEKKALNIVIVLAIIIFLFALSFSSLKTFFSGLLDNLTDLIVGLVLAYLFSPIFNFFYTKVYKFPKRDKLRKLVSAISSFLVFAIIITIIILLIVPQLVTSIAAMKNNLNYYISTVEKFITGFCEIFHIDPETVNLAMITSKIKAFIVNDIFTILDVASNIGIKVGGGILSALKTVVVAIFIAIYFILDKENIKNFLKKLSTKLFGEKFTNNRINNLAVLDKSFGQYLVGKFIDCLFVAILLSISYSIAGVPFSLLLACLVGFMNIFPFFGAWLGCIPAGFFVLIADPKKFVIFVIITAIIQQVDANIVEPKILGTQTGLGRFGVLAAIAVMGNLMGFVGLVIGVPLFASIKIFIMEYVNTEKDVVLLEVPEDLPTITEDVDASEQKSNENVIKTFLRKFIK